MKRTFLIALRIVAVLIALAAVCIVAAIVIARSDWFQDRVRDRIVAEIQKSTGARIEMGTFRFDWEHLVATVSPIVIHGGEPAGEAPFFRADSVSLGLRVISMLERKVDLASLRIDHPAVRIVFYKDGSNNVPAPRDRTPWTEDLLNLSVRQYQVNDGAMEYDGRAIPLDLRGERLRIVMNYDRQRFSRSEPRYRGQLSLRVRVAAGSAPAFDLDTSAEFLIAKARIEINALHLAGRDSHVDLSGVLTDPRSPRGDLNVKAAVAVKEAVQIFKLPISPAGSAAFDGQLSLSSAPAEFQLSGHVNARGLGYRQDLLQVTNADLRADVDLSRNSLRLDNVTLKTEQANLTGAAELADWRDLHIDANIQGAALREAVRIASGKSIPWDASITGGFTLDATLGERAAKLQTELSLAPVAGAAPLEGHLEALYDQRANTLTIENSHLSTPSTHIDASGVWGQTIQVRAETRNPDDFLPVLELVSDRAPKDIPVKLANGQITFRGSVTGAAQDPTATGDLSVSNASIQGHAIDRFSGEIEATRKSVRFRNATLARGAMTISGSGETDGEAISAQLTVRGAQIADLIKEAGSSLQISGTAAGTAQLSGSFPHPQAQVTAQIENAAGFGEQIDRLRVTAHYAPDRIDVSAGEAVQGDAKVTFSGAFVHPAEDWHSGDVRIHASTARLNLARIKTLAKLQPSLAAVVGGEATVAVHIAKGEVALKSIDGHGTARSVAWDRQPLGDVSATAETRGSDLSLQAGTQIRDIRIDAKGSWRLAGDDPGAATIHFSRASVASVSSVVMAGGPLEKSVPPFDGFVEDASANVSVALRKPLDFEAALTIPVLHISPQPTQTLKLGVQAQELVVENAKPIEITLNAREMRVRSAEFKARDTDLSASGAIAFDAKSPSELTIRGSMNLFILQLLNPDLTARGSATVKASIRGSLKDPQLNGRMDLKNASLYLGDLPNGVDNVNGSVIFDRNRATIEKLTAETGGGTLNFSGFLGFGTPLVYRLQAEAQKVRVRFPGDLSVTFNSNLALNGTSDSSTVSGSINLTRASFMPRSDVAQLFAQAARPSPAPAAPNDYIRGMQFDVRIESDPSFQLETSLARNLQAEVNLRLRGTPLRPALLGTASLNEGEIEVFGNRYTVNRGDVRFLNPVRIDPILDMNLETRARGVTVNIAIAGTMQKLNVNYSSDPPLQPREIIALLAVGRAPGQASDLNPEAASSNATSLAEAGGGLISQALTAQLSSRFQRFFGASRIKIDPTTNGAEYLPQARLTVEQQVSKDVTLTYITNLNRTQEQIVQIEWDFSKQWSAVAVRDADGLFGIDFTYRKRFK